MKQELLAPAGDIEAGYAAFYYGADAVYLGLQQFSARATATNFDEPALNELTGYAHSLGRKVYVAINTLVQEDELGDLMKSLDICVRCHVDALIVQDLGVVGIVRKVYPELEDLQHLCAHTHHLADAVAVVPGERELVIGLFVAAGIARGAHVPPLGDDRHVLYAVFVQTVCTVVSRTARTYHQRLVFKYLHRLFPVTCGMRSATSRQ